MNLYRLKNGRFEQIGWSWLKHGFFATNSSGCGSCQNPGTGSLLGPGCSDTYGTSNNSDRFYLGGRDEVNPLTGTWTCQNSYFSNYQNDCVRRNNGTGLDGVAHRLEVADADLTDSSAQYFYEAYYINANDTDRYNNAASRQATISWTGSGYSVNTVGGFVQGIALDRWGEMRNFAEPRDEGDVKVAVQTTDLGGGMWRYEYAVYNHTLDRQVRTFSIGVPAGATVQNIGFHDIDQDSGNQWTSSFSNGSLTWSTGAFGSPNANPLKYASLFNFRFECNVPPANSQAVLGMFKPGNGDTKTAYIKGPMTTQHLESFAVINASIGDGDIQSLGESDDNRMNLIPDFRNLRTSPGIEGTLTSPTQSVSSFSVTVESRNTLSTTHQEIWLFNWGTAQWETIDSRPTTLTDSVATVSVSSNPGRFIDASGQVKVRVIHVPPQGQLNSRWSIGIDKIGISFN
jgi:hypothetical protein